MKSISKNSKLYIWKCSIFQKYANDICVIHEGSSHKCCATFRILSINIRTTFQQTSYDTFVSTPTIFFSTITYANNNRTEHEGKVRVHHQLFLSEHISSSSFIDLINGLSCSAAPLNISSMNDSKAVINSRKEC